MRGRKPGPQALRVIHGTAERHRPAKHKVEPQGKAPPMPEWLTGEARAEWERTVPKLERLGVATDVDGAVLAAYCQAYGRWAEAEQLVSARGIVFETNQNHYRTEAPEAKAAIRYLTVMKQLAAELGLTPGSRARMVLPGEKPADDFEGILP